MGDYFQDVANEGQHLMADYIEETVWDMLDDSNVPPMFKDMIDLGVVNWRELADHYVTAETDGLTKRLGSLTCGWR
jgi:hypothetical protein